MEITLGSTLALIGLTLALIELYLPRLSYWLEYSLDRTAVALTPVYLGIGGAASQFNEWISETFIAEYYDRYHWKLVFRIFIPLALVGGLWEIGLVETGLIETSIEAWPVWIQWPIIILLGIPLFVVIVMSVPLALYVYLYPAFFGLCKLFSLPFWGIAKLIQVVNWAGRGKGLSGVGLIMALYDVGGHFV